MNERIPDGRDHCQLATGHTERDVVAKLLAEKLTNVNVHAFRAQILLLVFEFYLGEILTVSFHGVNKVLYATTTLSPSNIIPVSYV
jgi:hypothetical protein